MLTYYDGGIHCQGGLQSLAAVIQLQLACSVMKLMTVVQLADTH